jgi:multimeric flavodoxin WrbA
MGSPRRGGNTDILLDEVLAAASEAGAETTKYVIGALNIRPCYELYHCAVDGTCTINDDMLNLYEPLATADCVVLASPIFFYGITSQAKALVDRCQALWVRRHVLKTWQPDVTRRKGALIAVGATKGPRLFDGVTLTAKYFFDAIGVSYVEELLVRGVDAKGEIRQAPSTLDDARAMGARLAET